MRTIAAVAVLALLGTSARAATPGELFRAAGSDRRITAAEARRIAAAVRTAADRASLQRQLDQLADRVVPGAAETELRRVGALNLAGSARATVRRMPTNGVIDEVAMRRGLALIARDGFTPAERRTFRAALAGLQRPRAATRVRVTAAAWVAQRRLEERVDALTPSPWNQRLPSRPGESNRVKQAGGAGSELWPVRRGAPLHDGLGAVRGALAADSTKVNFGARRRIAGQWMLYAFATRITTPGGQTASASGWVPEAAFGASLAFMPTIDAPVPVGGASGPRYRLTGGVPARFDGARVNPNIAATANVSERATDYLLRQGAYVNLLYNLPGKGGVAIDTLPVGLTFVRATQVPSLSIPLYQTGSARRFRIPSMTFVYGRVVVPRGEDRYGWVAVQAMARLP